MFQAAECGSVLGLYLPGVDTLQKVGSASFVYAVTIHGSGGPPWSARENGNLKRKNPMSSMSNI